MTINGLIPVESTADACADLLAQDEALPVQVQPIKLLEVSEILVPEVQGDYETQLLFWARAESVWIVDSAVILGSDNWCPI